MKPAAHAPFAARPRPPRFEACRTWFEQAVDAHAGFASGELTEREYRRRLRALGCRRAEVADEVAIHRERPR